MPSLQKGHRKMSCLWVWRPGWGGLRGSPEEKRAGRGEGKCPQPRPLWEMEEMPAGELSDRTSQCFPCQAPLTTTRSQGPILCHCRALTWPCPEDHRAVSTKPVPLDTSAPFLCHPTLTEEGCSSRGTWSRVKWVLSCPSGEGKNDSC